jgi:uncharacterized OsmC-like protein
MDGERRAEGLVTVRGGADGFAQTVTAGTHHLRSDEPASAGGTDTGPTPYDLLLAALGSMYVHDGCHVCAPKTVAAGTCHGASSSLSSARS